MSHSLDYEENLFTSQVRPTSLNLLCTVVPVPLLISCPCSSDCCLLHSLICFVCCFKLCLIRRDMRTVQDRLLAQMVSRLDRFVPSGFELNTFPLLLFSLGTWSDLLEGMRLNRLSMLFLPVARDWDPNCEEKSACSVFPLILQVSIWSLMRGTHSASQDFLLTTFVVYLKF